MSNTSKRSRNFLLTALGVFASRLTGIVREQVLAYIFGATYLMDAFNISFRIPNMLRDLLAEGALSQSFVPIFSQYFAKDHDVAFSLAKRFIISQIALVSLVCITGYLFTSQFLMLFTHDNLSPETLALSLKMTEVLWLFLLFVSISSFFQGIYQTLNKFFLASVSSSLLNIGSIIFPCLSYLFLRQSEIQIWSVPLGFLFGALLQTMYLFKDLAQPLSRAKLSLTSWSDVYPIYKLFLGGSLGMMTTQLSVLISLYFSTGLVTGTISHLNYAYRIFLVPLGLIGVSYSVAHLPSVSRMIEEDGSEVGNYFNFGFNQLVLIAIPIAIFFYFTSNDLVSLFYFRGSFNYIDWQSTSKLLQIYSLSLPCLILLKYVTPNFYAFKKLKAPIFTSIISVFINYFFLSLFLDHLGATALPLSLCVSSLSALLIQLACLAFIKPKYIDILKFLSLTLAINLPLALGLYAISSIELHYFLRLLFFGIVTLTYVIGCLMIFPRPEAKEIREKMIKKLRKLHA